MSDDGREALAGLVALGEVRAREARGERHPDGLDAEGFAAKYAVNDDLIARLREHCGTDCSECDLDREAADAIEELTRENASLFESLQEMGQLHTEAVAEVERLKAELDLIHTSEMAATLRRLAYVETENDELSDDLMRVMGDLTKLRAAVGGLSPEAVEWAIRIGIAYTRVVYDDTEANNHAVIAAYQLCPPEVRAQITQGELT